MYVDVFCGNDYQYLKKDQSYVLSNLPVQLRLSAVICDFNFISTLEVSHCELCLLLNINLENNAFWAALNCY